MISSFKSAKIKGVRISLLEKLCIKWPQKIYDVTYQNQSIVTKKGAELGYC